MKWLYKYDENFNYLPGEELQIEDDDKTPDFYCDARPPDGLYLPKFDPKKNKWFESAAQEYIDSLQPPEPEPNPIDLLKKQNALLSLQIARLQSEVSELKGGYTS
ncbi:hypothetical protein P5609_012760 [Bacillus licheniformis]|uniref:hypothetical protein n=1 Tax=Bacillus licheniformis TaxID=1402 RepID=UPI00018C8E20|nr:hypothetical protein [Bacillus licheniformis]MBW7632534.1 hypothetical protein [Bacillus licheniformis]MDH3163860.1 hypothetical protein [Bacillus licheniformis]MED4409653.1 hypothetical protein [Bacillus licheniformis]QDL79377.1 hypothetical protein D9Y32_19135 [Bacillus licheniformis]